MKSNTAAVVTALEALTRRGKLRVGLYTTANMASYNSVAVLLLPIMDEFGEFIAGYDFDAALALVRGELHSKESTVRIVVKRIREELCRTRSLNQPSSRPDPNRSAEPGLALPPESEDNGDELDFVRRVYNLTNAAQRISQLCFGLTGISYAACLADAETLGQFRAKLNELAGELVTCQHANCKLDSLLQAVELGFRPEMALAKAASEASTT